MARQRTTMSRLVYRAVEPFPDSASPRAQTEFEDVYHGATYDF